MGASKALAAKRSPVKLILSLAAAYLVKVEINRDSEPAAVEKAYKRIILKAHPDKGGKEGDFVKLHRAKEDWSKAQAEAHVGIALI